MCSYLSVPDQVERDIPDPDPEVHWGARRVEAVREAKAEDAVAAAWAKKKKKKINVLLLKVNRAQITIRPAK